MRGREVWAAEAGQVLEEYLARYPAEAGPLSAVVWRLGEGQPLGDRRDFRGHVVVSAVVVNPAGAVLQVFHRGMRRWVPPGGHVEAGDVTLRGVAAREAAEETGLTVEELYPVGGLVQVWVHRYPARPERGEPEHTHYDFRFVFRTEGEVRALASGEVVGARWMPMELLGDGGLARRVRGMMG